MSYLRHISFSVFILIIITGCKDNFLDTKPYDALSDQTVWSSDKDAIKGVNGIYSALELNSHFGTNSFGDFAANFGKLGPAGMNQNGGAVLQGTSTSRTGIYANTYQNLYRIIRYANTAIKKLTDNSNVSEKLQKRLAGEAYFLRGLSYFYLWQLYGGVIILKKPVPPSKTYRARNSATESRQFVISDFKKAIQALPVKYSSQSDQGRATKGAAVAMLGKTFLFNKQWSKAADQFSKLMKQPYSYHLVENYSDLFIAEHDYNPETVFSLQYIMKADLGNKYDMRYGGRSTHSSAWNNSLASWQLVNSYTKENGDAIDMSDIPKLEDYSDQIKFGNALVNWYEEKFQKVDPRLKVNVIMPGATFIGNNSQVFKLYWPFKEHANDNPPAYRTNWSSKALFPWRKWVVTGNSNKLRWDAPADIPLIRYASVLLMYAEAKNEADGPSLDVMNAVNKVRKRAGVADLPAGLSKSKLRHDIRTERLHELAGEGHLYFDLRRWRTADTNDPVFGLNHDVLDFRGKKIYHRKFTEKNYLWPIPHQAKEINDKLEQNPGWGE